MTNSTQLRTVSYPCLAPSLLNADFGNIASAIKQLEDSSVQVLHIDVMDGCFVPPISFGDNIVSLAKRCSSALVEAHLMVCNPEGHIETFNKAGADRIIFHSEATPHAHRILQSLKSSGVSTGIAINPGTAVATVTELLELTDVLLIMTVNPGWGGQRLITSCLGKVAEAAAIIRARGLATRIEVDGGVNPETIADCVKAGADLFVTGSYLFQEGSIKERVATMQHAMDNVTVNRRDN